MLHPVEAAAQAAPPPPAIRSIASGSHVRQGQNLQTVVKLREQYGLHSMHVYPRRPAHKTWEDEYNLYMSIPDADPEIDLVLWWQVILSIIYCEVRY